MFTFNVKAQDKIAFIDLVYLYNNSNVGKEMNNEIKKERDKINKEFKEFQKKIDNEKETLVAQKNVTAEGDYKKKVFLLEKNIQEYNLIISNKRDELAELNNKIRINFSNKLRPILEEYSKNNSIGMILRKENLLIGKNNLDVTLGMQMVLMPQDGDQIIPFAKLGKELRPDYSIIKHCTDNEDGDLGVDYNAYEKLYPSLKDKDFCLKFMSFSNKGLPTVVL